MSSTYINISSGVIFMHLFVRRAFVSVRFVRRVSESSRMAAISPAENRGGRWCPLSTTERGVDHHPALTNFTRVQPFRRRRQRAGSHTADLTSRRRAQSPKTTGGSRLYICAFDGVRHWVSAADDCSVNTVAPTPCGRRALYRCKRGAHRRSRLSFQIFWFHGSCAVGTDRYHCWILLAYTSYDY